MRFNGQVVGTVYLGVEPANHLLTSPVRRAGFLQQFGGVNSDSRNLLYANNFYVMCKAADNLTLTQAIAALQALQGLTGDIEIGSETVPGLPETFAANALWQQWVIDEVQSPKLPRGYGGRFCEELGIIAVGDTPPLYF